MTRPSFRQQILRAREEAILASTSRLLADKGFDAMTIDAVAADVGIAKASLYKHFASKDLLATAAMLKLLDRVLAFLTELEATASSSPLDRLRAATRWTMQAQLAGEMPWLSARNSALRAALAADQAFGDRLNQVGALLGGWIAAAQKTGQLNPQLPPEVILYTLYARACDPVLELLRAGGKFQDERIVEMLLSTCFDGLSAGALPGRARPGIGPSLGAGPSSSIPYRVLRR